MEAAPISGTHGKSGTRYLRSISGARRRSTTSDRLTSVNVSRNIRLAADPTTWMGRSSEMPIIIKPVTRIAICGVRLSECILAMPGGQPVSAHGKGHATGGQHRRVQRGMVDSNPPKTMVATPNAGMKLSAAFTIAVSWYRPRTPTTWWTPLNRAQGNKDDQQIDNHGHAQGNERGLRNIRLGLFDFLGNGRDEIVPSNAMNVSPWPPAHRPTPLGEMGRNYVPPVRGPHR